MRTLRGKVALVTGAASGIGEATARALAAEGCRLVLCDVDAAGLETIAGELDPVLSAVVDVGDKDAMEAFAAEVHAQVGAVDILVNNAGVGTGGMLVDTPLEDWEWVVRVNLMGVIHGCHFFVPPMVARGQGGHVVNVASAAGYVALGGMGPYAATKFGVLGLSESLRRELRPQRIGVSTICPGLISTKILDNGRLRGLAERPGTMALLQRMLVKQGADPSTVARAIVRGIRKNRGVVPVTAPAWGLYYIKRFAPGLLGLMDRWAMKQLDRS